jgi:hypothetical protein
MHEGRLVFSQVMEHLPLHAFRRCVARYEGDRYVKSFRCMDQYFCMAFAQLTYRESLRDIEACLRSQAGRLYHMGIRGTVSRNTLANANQMRDWRIYADFAQTLIQEARELYAGDDFGIDIGHAVYALDSTVIDLCLSLFPWAPFMRSKAAVRLHTLLDLRGNIPAFVHISDSKLYDSHALDLLPAEAGAFYVMDRGYLDFIRLHRLHEAGAFFVIRAKSNTKSRRLYSRPVDKSKGLRCDQTVVLTGQFTADYYPDHLRRIRYHDDATGKDLVFLTNNMLLPALIVPQIYKSRWQIELFFRWIKQNLRIKSFYGTSENAVRTQIWIALSVYLAAAIVKKRLNIETSLYTFLQVVSVNIFEKTPLLQLFEKNKNLPGNLAMDNQLNLFD